MRKVLWNELIFNILILSYNATNSIKHRSRVINDINDHSSFMLKDYCRVPVNILVPEQKTMTFPFEGNIFERSKNQYTIHHNTAVKRKKMYHICSSAVTVGILMHVGLIEIAEYLC